MGSRFCLIYATPLARGSYYTRLNWQTALGVQGFDYEPVSARSFLGLWRTGLCARAPNRFELEFKPVARKLPRYTNTEMFMKRVAVRAVNFSIGAFCTEFRHEQLCDDAIFWIGVNFWTFFAI